MALLSSAAHLIFPVKHRQARAGFRALGDGTLSVANSLKDRRPRTCPSRSPFAHRFFALWLRTGLAMCATACGLTAGVAGRQRGTFTRALTDPGGRPTARAAKLGARPSRSSSSSAILPRRCRGGSLMSSGTAMQRGRASLRSPMTPATSGRRLTSLLRGGLAMARCCTGPLPACSALFAILRGTAAPVSPDTATGTGASGCVLPPGHCQAAAPAIPQAPFLAARTAGPRPASLAHAGLRWRTRPLSLTAPLAALPFAVLSTLATTTAVALRRPATAHGLNAHTTCHARCCLLVNQRLSGALHWPTRGTKQQPAN